MFFYEVTIHTLTHLKVLGWFPCAQVTSHLKCIRLVAVRSSLLFINIGVRTEQCIYLFLDGRFTSKLF